MMSRRAFSSKDGVSVCPSSCSYCHGFLILVFFDFFKGGVWYCLWFLVFLVVVGGFLNMLLTFLVGTWDQTWYLFSGKIANKL